MSPIPFKATDLTQQVGKGISFLQRDSNSPCWFGKQINVFSLQANLWEEELLGKWFKRQPLALRSHPLAGLWL